MITHRSADEPVQNKEGQAPRVTGRYVGPREFLALAICRKKLVRADDATAHLRGLFDATEGIMYVTNRDQLLGAIRNRVQV